MLLAVYKYFSGYLVYILKVPRLSFVPFIDFEELFSREFLFFYLVEFE